MDLDPFPKVHALTLADGGYRILHTVEAGAMLSTELAADKPVPVSFDPAVLARFSGPDGY